MKKQWKILAKNVRAARKQLALFWRPYYLVLVLAVVLAGLFLWQNKGLIVAATVNGRPVWRWEAEGKLVSRYGDQVLEELVAERLIFQAATERGLRAEEGEILAKIAEIERGLNGQMKLEEALMAQGMTMAELRRQIELQIVLEKANADKLTVSEQEVKDYIEKNRALLSATDAAGLEEEARRIILSGRKSEVLQRFFADLKGKAKVVKYL